MTSLKQFHQDFQESRRELVEVISMMPVATDDHHAASLRRSLDALRRLLDNCDARLKALEKTNSWLAD